VGYTGGEGASTGLPYTSHDIGGFNGSPPDDLYVRWVQLGAFQPIDRLHSNHAPRLPWEYSDAARTAAEKFLRLREALVPYTYTAAQQAQATGVPIVRTPYLAYPDQPGAYEYADSEYLYGPNMLVAPATTPGTTSSTQVWFPPGSWTDYFTGQTFTGPSVHAVTTGWDTMPVFLKGGGIVAERSDNVTNDAQNPMDKLTLEVAAGASGSYDLYEDAGDGHGASSTTSVRHAGSTLTILPARGRFAGQVASRQWTARFLGVERPSEVDIDGRATSTWTYDESTRTVTVTLAARPINAHTTIRVR
jgi:alpha-glucosidase (family GH31 glycosyl hydrolase)